MNIPGHYRVATFVVLGFAAALIIGWDIFLAIKHSDGAETISQLTVNAVQSHLWALTLFIYSLGFLSGHLLWPQFRSAGGG